MVFKYYPLLSAEMKFGESQHWKKLKIVKYMKSWKLSRTYSIHLNLTNLIGPVAETVSTAASAADYFTPCR